MSMRPSLRCARIRALSSSGAFILGSNSLPGKAGFARSAGSKRACLAHRTTARPGELHQLARQTRGELRLSGVVHGVDPLYLGLTELARAVALVKRVEHAALARRAILDVGVARKRRDRDAV